VGRKGVWMCGIAGAVCGSADASVGEAVVRATQALRHRGPDGVGFWHLCGDRAERCSAHEMSRAADVLFGHRRLSIVDLTGGDQPMPNEDGSIWLVFNGEIYNHRDLRSQLEGLGHRYRTDCDTETIVHGFEEWGVELFGRLNGIFAFA